MEPTSQGRARTAEELVAGPIMQIDEEFRLQTAEGAEWEQVHPAPRLDPRRCYSNDVAPERVAPP